MGHPHTHTHLVAIGYIGICLRTEVLAGGRALGIIQVQLFVEVIEADQATQLMKMRHHPSPKSLSFKKYVEKMGSLKKPEMDG